MRLGAFRLGAAFLAGVVFRAAVAFRFGVAFREAGLRTVRWAADFLAGLAAFFLAVFAFLAAFDRAVFARAVFRRAPLAAFAARPAPAFRVDGVRFCRLLFTLVFFAMNASAERNVPV